MTRFFDKNTDPKAPLLIGLIISKSLIDVGADREDGTTDGIRGERGPPEGLLGQSIERRRVLNGIPSRGIIEGEMGGVIVTRGSKAAADFGRIIMGEGSTGLPEALFVDSSEGNSSRFSSTLVSPAFSTGLMLALRDIGSGSCEAMMGSASASGDEIDDGVEDLVNKLRFWL